MVTTNIIYDVFCDILHLCSIAEGGQVNGDPHFMVTSQGHSDRHLCYDVHGKSDDQLILLYDHQIGEWNED